MCGCVRERGRERGRERERERESDRETEGDTERARESEREREIERDRRNSSITRPLESRGTTSKWVVPNVPAYPGKIGHVINYSVGHVMEDSYLRLIDLCITQFLAGE